MPNRAANQARHRALLTWSANLSAAPSSPAETITLDAFLSFPARPRLEEARMLLSQVVEAHHQFHRW